MCQLVFISVWLRMIIVKNSNKISTLITSAKQYRCYITVRLQCAGACLSLQQCVGLRSFKFNHVWILLKANEKYRGMFEFQRSGDKTSSGEIGLDIRTHASPKVGKGQVSGGISVFCWHAALVWLIIYIDQSAKQYRCYITARLHGQYTPWCNMYMHMIKFL